MLLRSHSTPPSDSEACPSEAHLLLWMPGSYCSHAVATQSFRDGKKCRATPARPSAGHGRLRDTRLHKREGSREEWRAEGTMGKWNGSSWTLCRLSGGCSSKPLRDSNVASTAHILGENTKTRSLSISTPLLLSLVGKVQVGARGHRAYKYQVTGCQAMGIQTRSEIIEKDRS